jgi:hypothetical protein
MGGGLLQLVAYGAQDVYLTGNPQITFFKAVYRRHTNFAIEAIEQTFNGTPDFGSRVTCQISRNGDLINRVYLQLRLTPLTDSYCKYFGLRVLNYVEIEIGGQRIDRHYAHWLYVWNELTLPASKRDGWNDMVGAYGGTTGSTINSTLYVPLEFWFCRNVGLALPLIALQYHEVKININFETEAKCKFEGTTAKPSFTASLWVDYIFLDTDERRRFAQLTHEYLIEQLQFTGEETIGTSATPKIKMNFNHPCKELVWFLSNSNNNTNNWFNYTTKVNSVDNTVSTSSGLKSALMYDGVTGNNSELLYPSNPVTSAKLVLNGNDRFATRDGVYFNVVQPYQHHENIPANAGINVYSFALKPEEHQPSGTLNMSRIDTAILQLGVYSGTAYSKNYTLANTTLYIYATNYNVLRILSGMGGLAYSN